jgi:hypothetical protein
MLGGLGLCLVIAPLWCSEGDRNADVGSCGASFRTDPNDEVIQMDQKDNSGSMLKTHSATICATITIVDMPQSFKRILCRFPIVAAETLQRARIADESLWPKKERQAIGGMRLPFHLRTIRYSEDCAW